MKRDMDLVRTILLKIEGKDKVDDTGCVANAANLGIDGSADADIAYNSGQLVDEGFVTGNTKMAARGLVIVNSLTWKGHDFLDSVRDPKIWEKTKKGVEGAGGFTVELMKDLAKGFVKKQIEDYTGVKL